MDIIAPEHLTIHFPTGDAITILIFLLLIYTGTFTLYYCFPACNFVWKDYETVFKKKDTRGKFILATIILAIIINIIAGLITGYLGARIGLS